jgi:hypothetical protein
MTPHIVLQDVDETYSVSFTTSGIKVKGPAEVMARLIALYVRQSEESYSPAHGDRASFIAREVSSRTGLKVRSVRRSPHEKDTVY